MSEILQYLLTSLISIIGTGSIGSIFYFRLQKRLKEAEVKAAEVEVKSSEIANLSASNEEWIKLYNSCNEEKRQLEMKMSEVIKKFEENIVNAHKDKDSLWEKLSDCRQECDKKDLYIAELNWYRCEVNGCPYRKPPRKFGQMDFPKEAIDPSENPDPDAL